MLGIDRNPLFTAAPYRNYPTVLGKYKYEYPSVKQKKYSDPDEYSDTGGYPDTHGYPNNHGYPDTGGYSDPVR